MGGRHQTGEVTPQTSGPSAGLRVKYDEQNMSFSRLLKPDLRRLRGIMGWIEREVCYGLPVMIVHGESSKKSAFAANSSGPASVDAGRFCLPVQFPEPC